MMRGEKVTGGTVFASSDPAVYCAMANAGYDFIWTEMQHSTRDWDAVARMWHACPDAKAVPGVRVAYADEREIQHATDAGALVVVIPTVRNLAEGIAGRNWTFFPPLGKRSVGGGQARGSLDAFANFLQAKTKEIQSAYGCSGVKYTVEVKNGRARIKAKPNA